MRWLVRLVTPPGATVLETFTGSGTTMLAAEREGLTCLGIEREPAYCDIIRARLSAAISTGEE
jgi:DNA modification methylase